MDYEIQFDIDDQVTDRFGRHCTVCGYYIGRAGLRYELEQEDKTWYEYPQYVQSIRSIGFNEN